MARPRRTLIRIALLLGASLLGVMTCADDSPPLVRIDPAEDRLAIFVNDQPFATYVFRDREITRPYFCNVHTPSGVLVTRPQPLGPDDLDDHVQMHPGIWLAFGDLGGQDCWRLKAPVQHVEFVQSPTTAGSRMTFAVRNRYHGDGGQPVLCDEVCRYTISARSGQTLLTWDSLFEAAEGPIAFGDQEEMGLGVRMASVIAEKMKHGGLLTNSDGLTTASNVWGQAADWCDYSGVIDGRPVGITIAAHSNNFRRPWWHARDYGFMAANPFGRQAMKQGERSRVEIKPGETLRLRFTIIVHDGRPGDGYDPAAVVSAERL